MTVTGSGPGAEPAAQARRPCRLVYVADVAEGPSCPARVGWRIDSANNRPVGHGVGVHDSVAACTAAVARLVDHLPELRPRSAFDNRSGRWSWHVLDADSMVAISARSYARRFDCLRALNQFREAVGAVAPDAGSVLILGPRGVQPFLTPPGAVQGVPETLRPTS